MMIRTDGWRKPALATAASLTLALWDTRPAAQAPAAIRFENVTAKAGLATRLDQNPTPDKNMVETMAGGLAVFDYDGDGLARHLLHERRATCRRSPSAGRSIGTGCSAIAAT